MARTEVKVENASHKQLMANRAIEHSVRQMYFRVAKYKEKPLVVSVWCPNDSVADLPSIIFTPPSVNGNKRVLVEVC
jgi:hypothetical protein